MKRVVRVTKLSLIIQKQYKKNLERLYKLLGFAKQEWSEYEIKQNKKIYICRRQI